MIKYHYSFSEMERIKSKEVKDRTDGEHLFLIKFEYSGSIRNYLLSMGEFKDVDVLEGGR